MGSEKRIWLWAGGVALAACLCGAARAQGLAAAQGTAVQSGAGQDAALPVLHVYADLLQIPVLVLTRDQERLSRPAAAENFSISLARGPWFRATHVRQEGEDPISLSILLDMSGWTGEAMAKVDAAVAALGLGPLHAQDRVEVYALDCQLATAEGRMEPDATRLRDAVDTLLATSAERRAHVGRGCGRSYRLRDALAALIAGLSVQPGRRVILAVTDGGDSGSRESWRELAFAAQERSVTVFGVTYRPLAAGLGPRDDIPMQRGPGNTETEPQFPGLCSLSGGAVRVVNEPKLMEPMRWVIQTVRERYILEFPRPANATPGKYELTVRLDGGPDDYIRPAGLTFPQQSKAVLDDPTTVKDETTQRPVVGGRKSLPVNH